MPDPSSTTRASYNTVFTTDEVTEADLIRVLSYGWLIGIPIAYAIAFLVSLPGVGLHTALLVAFLPAGVAGPWLGGTILLAKRCAQIPSRAAVVTLPKLTPASLVVPPLAA
jgi:hypothetical protein